MDFGCGLELLFMLMVGEYVNMMYFISDEDVVFRLEIFISIECVYKVVVFMDGI